MKKFLSLFLVLVLALSFAAAAGAESEKRTITFWYSSGDAIGQAILDNVNAFNESQNEIFVDAQYQGAYDESLVKIRAAVPQGKGPDVFHIYEMATAYLCNVDWVVPFSDMLEKDPFITLDDINGAMRNYYTVDGKFMCLPFSPSSPVMYYNKTAFDAAGIAEAPTTFAEIAAIAERLASVDANPDYAMGLSIYGWFFEALLVGAGYYYVDNENGRVAPATRIDYDVNGGGRLVMEAWKQLVDDGVLYDFGIDNAGARAAFMNGTVSIIFDSTAQLATLTSGSPFEVGVAMLPSVLEERVDRAIIGGGNLWIVNSGNEQRVADSWEFMKFMASAEPAAKFSMATGYYAANRSAYDVPEYVAYLDANPNARVALEQLEASELSNLTASLFTGVSSELRKIWQNAMELYLLNVYSIEETLKNCAEESNAVLAAYNTNLAG